MPLNWAVDGLQAEGVVDESGLIGNEGEEPTTVPPYLRGTSSHPSGEDAGTKVEGSRVQFLWGFLILNKFYVSYPISYFNY